MRLSGLSVLSGLVVALAGGAYPEEFVAEVVEVVAGDTVAIVRDDQSNRTTTQLVHIDGIDTPEIKQDGGKAAKELTKRLVLGKRCVVSVQGTDEQGRAIGDIVRGSGNALSVLLLKAGYARCTPDHPFKARLLPFEEEARKAGKGIWREIVPIPEDEVPVSGDSPDRGPKGRLQARVPADSWTVRLVQDNGSEVNLGHAGDSTEAPAGLYRLASIRIAEKGSDGAMWTVFGGRGPATVVLSGKRSEAQWGPPLTARIRLVANPGELQLQFEMTGQGGEQYFGFERNGKRLEAPRFEIRDETGHLIAAGQFEYG